MSWETLISFLSNQTPLFYLNQPLWRDEAFSVLISESPVAKIIQLTAKDFNPPLYYLLLHFWMKIFGNGEIAIRMLSFIFHLGLVYLVYKFTETLKFSKLTARCLLLATLLNPMLIYFAFEARMYSLLAFLTTASMYFFYIKNWKAYVLTTALGFWTQPFLVFVIASQGFYLLITGTLKKEHLVAFVASFFFFLPWFPVILEQFSRSGPMWIWPINWTTVTTILGNLFTGYEGTPWGLWNKMKILSLAILFLGFLIFRSTFQLKKKPLGEFSRLLLIWLFLPVIFVLFISYFKPIYVNRYLIFVTVAEVFLITMGISLFKNKLLANIFYLLFLIFIFAFNIWFPPLRKKSDIRLTFAEIKNLAKANDLIFSQTPLTFFEANYYFSDRSRVFLYKPPAGQKEIPVYLGSVLIPEEKWKSSFPQYPTKAFLIHDNGTFETISQR